MSNLDLSTIKAVVSDMDGVLWRGDTPLPGFTSFFEFLQTHNIPFMLATNNSRRTRQQYLDKFAGFGVTITTDNLLTSAIATGLYLQQEFPEGGKLFIVGEDGLYEAAQTAGLTVVDSSDEPVEAVVVGLDFTVTYNKLKQAALLIQQGARFIGSNGDLSFPFEDGFAPGAGSLLAALHAATGVHPTVIGKPEPLVFEIAVEKMGLPREQILMVGDRLETDILGAQRVGLKTVLVTSGVDTEASIIGKNIQPDMVCTGIDTLVAQWQTMYT